MTGTPFLPRASYRDVRIHDVDPGRVGIELADNTSPFGVPPAALDAVRRITTDALAQYPSTYSRDLREAFARYVGVYADEVLVGAGSDEVMSCAFRALADPGASVAHMNPTFVMAPVFTITNSLVPVAVPPGPDLALDAEALLRAGTPLVYVCTPNNPTGLPIAPAALDRIANAPGRVVLVDEAYAEYAGTNLAAQAPLHGRLLVFRTLSKAFGMAGFRVGFAVGSRLLIRELEKARGPYTVCTLSEHAATAALREDVPWVRRGAALVREYRDRFIGDLRALGFAVVPSAANFVLVPVPDSPDVSRNLLERGVRVRHFRDIPGIGDALRITIGGRDTMSRVRDLLAELVPCA